jgi:RnfABCDGE-type electron transport complex C subunit
MSDDLIKAVEQAGVVGAGGAGFPTHIKLQSQVHTVIANGCECEPLLESDTWLMTNYAEEVVRGLSLVVKVTGAKRGVLAVKKKNKKAIAALEKAISSYPRLEIVTVGNFYPIGDEHLLVYEVTGSTIPIGGIPLDVGVLVQNVTTLANVSAAFDGRPVLDKIITVVGAVRTPGIYQVPVGIPVGFVLESAGGVVDEEPFRVIEGGPMMGKLVGLDHPLTKTSSGLLILAADHPLVVRKVNPRKSPRDVCCNCNECSNICPRSLLGHPLYPHKIMRILQPGLDHPELKHALLCSECALCEAYACPMDLSPMAVNSDLKKTFSVAGLRYPGGEIPEVYYKREWMKVPTERLLQRLKLADFKLSDTLPVRTLSPSRIIIPLKQHIGAPARAVISVGDRVKKGDLIGELSGKVSARVHASIDGEVEAIGETVTICS